MNMTVPDSLLMAAQTVQFQRRNLAARHEELCVLNDELRAAGGVAFSAPDPTGMCISYRANKNHTIMGRGLCAAHDRACGACMATSRLTNAPPPCEPAHWAPTELTARMEAAYVAWQAAGGDAERAKLFFEAEGQAFLNEILSKGDGHG